MKKQIALLSFIIIIFACKENKVTVIEDNDSNAAVQVSLEGKLYTIEQDNLGSDIVIYKDDIILFNLWEDGNPVQVNFNLESEILEKGSGEYNIPEDNTPKIKADLNFFNQDRKVDSDLNKRIIFRKGTINIKKLTKQKLEMSFEGEGSGMRERDKNFPISGKININY